MSEPGKASVLLIGGINEEPDLFLFIYRSICEIIEREFYNRYPVLQPESVSDAIQYAKTRELPLVIVGYDYQEIEGLALAGAMKGYAPQSTVLLILPYNSLEKQDEAKSLGIDHCLALPFNADSYERIARDVLNAYVQRRLGISVPANSPTAERVGVIVKGGFGAIPGLGSVFSEVIGNFIPNHRMNRIESILHILAVRIQGLSEERIQQRFRDPRFVDLFEDGMYQAVRALSDERLHYIAALLKNSLSDEEVNHLQDKHLLQLLGELNDAEVIVLKFQSFRIQRSAEATAFREQHASVLESYPVVTGTPQPVIDKSTIHRSFNQHLMQLGLFTGKFARRPGKQGLEWDTSTGMLKSEGYGITRLGMLLLRRIDLAEDDTDR
jgi:hypothetical protein